ncbi:beta-N-acetylhexosaminidase [Candidatus Paracaedibacter symbiosus]|uniref:beta-N-acetylhexosaminidase n=1 Tax=Candidatus Paracaedibacter symbiosus TaxID=244582 RepID=UPI000690CA36|nr:beta-N-acetylhexosaminidase [Candidatus Paracaedibacter symbiosus]
MTNDLPLPKSVIFGCSGTALTSEEIDLYKRTQPLGFILFSRNCDNPMQIESLISQLKSCVNHEYVPILIDQEGGRVARLGLPHWRQYPPPAVFGKIADDDLDLATWCAETNAYLMGIELIRMGINVNCAPILDLSFPETHPIIGDRAFHESPEIVTALGLSVLRGFEKAGVTGVIKHLPGHGRALVDSHESLPRIQTSEEELNEVDFLPFKGICNHILYENLSYPWGMTAHIVYDAIDEKAPATQSYNIIQKVIRDEIGFNGLLISDCLTMKALSGPFQERAAASIEAGCDVVLHCSGNLEEMIDVAVGCPPLSADALERLNASVAKVISHTEESEPALVEKLTLHIKSYLEK